MAIRKITGITSNIRLPYVCGMKDPRKVPLNQCVSLGDMMATIQICKELDEKDKKRKKEKK